MTDTSWQPASPQSPTRIRLPRAAVAFFVISPILLFVGAITMLSTAGFDYFERAMTQATVGTVMFIIGLAFLLAGIVLVGLRGMVQQQLDVLLQVEREGGRPSPQPRTAAPTTPPSAS